MTEIRAQEDAIILAASNQVVTLGSQMGQNMLDGHESTARSLYNDLKKLNILLKSYQYKADYTDQQIDSLLYALKKLSKANDFPVVSPLVGKDLSYVIVVSNPAAIEFQFNGSSLGTGITKVNFTGTGLDVVRTGEKIDVSIKATPIINLGSYTVSGGLFPDAPLGTGAGGQIEDGNEWYINGDSVIQGVNVIDGTIARAKTNNPGQTLSNWIFIYP